MAISRADAAEIARRHGLPLSDVPTLMTLADDAEDGDALARQFAPEDYGAVADDVDAGVGRVQNKTVRAVPPRLDQRISEDERDDIEEAAKEVYDGRSVGGHSQHSARHRGG